MMALSWVGLFKWQKRGGRVLPSKSARGSFRAWFCHSFRPAGWWLAPGSGLAGPSPAAISRAASQVHHHVRDPAAMAGLGDKQTLAKLCRVEINEVAVAFGPPAGCEVITEAVHCPLLGVRPDSGPD
jgi:hypothetical protein